MALVIRRVLFFWIASYSLASLLYFILWNIMPHHYVFGAFFRMQLYHWEHPYEFIAIPCFFYGIFATYFADRFLSKSLFGKILLSLFIVFITAVVSSPFGGMLWHYYDMKAGYFPINWMEKLLVNGALMGLEFGWLVIALSIPYNIIGCFLCYYLTLKGSTLFKSK